LQHHGFAGLGFVQRLPLAARSLALGGLGVVGARCRGAFQQFALALGLQAGGFGLLAGFFQLQALLFALQGLGGLGAFLGQFFGAFARLHFAGSIAAGAFAVGVGDLAGARVLATHHLGLCAGRQQASAQHPGQDDVGAEHGGAWMRCQGMLSELGRHWPVLGL